MLGKQQVFISHSAKDDPFALQVLERLHRLLVAKNYEALVDQYELVPEEEWESQIVPWMASCDFAIVLLTRKALKSEWVRDEATRLYWRHKDPSEKLSICPVLLNGIEPRDVLNTPGLDRLGVLEFLRCQDMPAAEDVADKIASRFAALPARESVEDDMWKWLARVAKKLKRLDDPKLLVEAALALGLNDDDSGQARCHGGELFLAEKLLHSGLSEQAVEAIKVLAPFMPPVERKDFIEEMVPSWVDPGAAKLILGTQQADRQVALLNARRLRTGEEYFQRATCRALDNWSESIGQRGGFDPVGALLSEWEAALDDLCVEPGGEPPPLRCFLIIDPYGTSLDIIAEAIRAMHKDYPWLGFLVLTGETLPDSSTVHKWQLPNTVPVLPELWKYTEIRARQTVQRLELAKK